MKPYLMQQEKDLLKELKQVINEIEKGKSLLGSWKIDTDTSRITGMRFIYTIDILRRYPIKVKGVKRQ